MPSLMSAAATGCCGKLCSTASFGVQFSAYFTTTFVELEDMKDQFALSFDDL